MSVPVFRFAPSPNGRLHLGHAYSALLNEKMAREAGARLLLRIEDTDQTRCTPKFTAGVFEDLAWLGIAWENPVRVQSEHFGEYQANLERLWSLNALYPCFCSRKLASAEGLSKLDPDGLPLYAGTCREIPEHEAKTRIAARAIHGWRLDMRACGDPDAAIWGDVVIAKPHVGSMYHIAVVTDDAAQGITHVVRGMDIAAATPIHRLLQRLLGLPTPRYHHHRLLLNDERRKLSKSIGSKSIAALREDGVTAYDIRAGLGFG